MPPIKFPSLRPKRNVYSPDLWTKCPSCEEMLFNKQLDKQMRSPGLRPPLPALGVDPDRAAGRPRHMGRARRRPAVRRRAGLRRPEGIPGPAHRGADRDRDARRRHMGHGRHWPHRGLAMRPTSGSWAVRWGPVGEGTRAAEHALAARIPLVVVSSSGGARMQEGTFASRSSRRPCCDRTAARRGRAVHQRADRPDDRGVFASYAAVGDVNVAEPNALIGFAARVSAGTIAQELAARSSARVPVQPRVRGPRRRAPRPPQRAGAAAAVAAARRSRPR